MFLRIKRLCIFSIIAIVAGASFGSDKVLCIPINGIIDYTQECIVRRGLKMADKLKCAGVILEVQTPGGNLKNTLTILQLLERYQAKKVAFVNTEALSAGSLIAIACDEIYLHPSAVIGAAAVVDAQGGTLSPMLQKKTDSYVLGVLRSLKNNSPRRYQVQRAMMEVDYEFELEGKLIKPKGELLTLTAKEACVSYGDQAQALLGNGMAASLEEVGKIVFNEAAELIPLRLLGFEKLAKYLVPCAAFFAPLGFLCLLIEFKTPGFGLFGLMGIICLLFPLFANVLAGFAGSEVFILLIIGTFCVVLDCLCGTLVLSCLGLLFILGSLWWANVDVWSSESLSWAMLLSPLKHFFYLGILFAIGFVFLWKRGYLKAGFRHIQLFKRMDEVACSAEKWVGREALVVNPLRPHGTICIDHKILEAYTLEPIIPAGERVQVVAYKNLSYQVIRRKKENDAAVNR